jgi:hypothetical protein
VVGHHHQEQELDHRLREMYSNVSVHATADLEHQASISEDSGWETDTFSFDQYVGQAMAKVRGATGGGATDELLDDIDARITSSVLRQSLFSAARDVAGVDHDLDPEEESLLGQVAVRFA